MALATMGTGPRGLTPWPGTHWKEWRWRARAAWRRGARADRGDEERQRTELALTACAQSGAALPAPPRGAHEPPWARAEGVAPRPGALRWRRNGTGHHGHWPRVCHHGQGPCDGTAAKPAQRGGPQPRRRGARAGCGDEERGQATAQEAPPSAVATRKATAWETLPLRTGEHTSAASKRARRPPRTAGPRGRRRREAKKEER